MLQSSLCLVGVLPVIKNGYCLVLLQCCQNCSLYFIGYTQIQEPLKLYLRLYGVYLRIMQTTALPYPQLMATPDLAFFVDQLVPGRFSQAKASADCEENAHISMAVILCLHKA